MTSDTLESELPEMSHQPSLGVASASQQAMLSGARKQLLEGVIEFLRKMKNGGESELGHNPRSEDLIPYFQQRNINLAQANKRRYSKLHEEAR